MNDRKDDFWKDLMEGNETGAGGEKPKDTDKDSGMDFLIEYLNKNGDIVDSKNPDEAKKEEDDFWAQFEDIKTDLTDGGSSSSWQQIPQERPAAPKTPPVQKPAQPTRQQSSAPKPSAQNSGSAKPPVNPQSQKPVSQPQRPVQQPQRPSQPQKPAQQPQKPAQGAQRPAQPSQPPKPASQRPSQPTKPRPSQEELLGAKDFEVDFDFDGEYQDVNEKVIKRGRSKRTGCLSGILYFVFIICISVVLACLGWMAAVDVLGLDAENSEVTITVPKELITTETREETDDDGNTVTKDVSVADIGGVADILYDQGLIRYKWIFKVFCKFSSADEKIKAGTYVLNMNYDYRALVYGMNPSSGKREEIDVTIPEGYNTYQIVSLLEDKGVCFAEDLWDAIENYDFDYDFIDPEKKGEKTRLEGYLFPDTYTFYISDTASRVINKLLSNFNKKWTDEYQEKADELGYTQYEILTIASMIEKEAGNDSERSTISSVIYNRLNNPDATNGLLQIDATIYYAIADTGEEFSTSVDSPYNTYKYKGLTPGPIANPGKASIEAALNPDSTSYYYYALGTDGVHHFFKTLDEHTAFVNSDEYAR